MYQFNCENLGITLDINIFSGFIQLGNVEDVSDGSLCNEDQNSYDKLRATIISEGFDFSIILEKQLERFKAECMKESFTDAKEIISRRNTRTSTK